MQSMVSAVFFMPFIFTAYPGGYSRLPIKWSLFQDSNFTEPVQGWVEGYVLYIQGTLEETIPTGSVLVLLDVWVPHTINPRSPEPCRPPPALRTDLIRNKCPATPQVTLLESGSSQRVAFSVLWRPGLLPADIRHILIVYEAELCDPTASPCSPVCPKWTLVSWRDDKREL